MTSQLGTEILQIAMKKILQNLLIVLALCLCGLIAFQWVREARTHARLEALVNEVHDKAEAIQNLDGQLKRSEAEVQRLDKLKTEMTETIKSNRLEITQLTGELKKTGDELDRSQRQIEAYKSVMDQANENIRTQNEEIKKQNEQMKKLLADRNETVTNYNKLAADYNDLAKKWNDLQEQLKKQGEKK